MSALYKGGRIKSSDLKRFLDRKVAIRLRDKYVDCFLEAFPDDSPRINEFEKWAKELRFSRNGFVTPNDAQEVWEIVSKV
ncbi:MAG: hypothetical protein WC178_01390 [Candidatus Paceibacterota bacterium]